jgi:glycosyltransferase involved in cell wall biosynthesis
MIGKMKKLLILTTSFPRWENDFYSPFLLDYSTSLVENGVEVMVVTTHLPGTELFNTIRNVNVTRIKYFFEKGEILQETRAGIPAAWKKNKLSIFLVLFFIFRLFFYLIKHGKQYDYIHTHWTITSLAAVIAKPFHKRKIVTSLHGSDIFLATKNFFFRFLTKYALHNSDKIFCVSNAIKEEILTLGILSSKIIVFPNGIDLKRFQNKLPIKNNNLLFVGSLTENKNVDILISSFRSIHEHYKNFNLVIIGDGPEKNNLRSLTERFGLQEFTFFKGNLTPDQVVENLFSSYLLILPSKNEGFGVVLLEAMASSLPCIASRTGGIVEIINSSVGCLFDVGNIDQLTECIDNLIRDEEKYQQLSSNCQSYVRENYDWGKIVPRMIDVFNNL